jgi:hypothetical protein
MTPMRRIAIAGFVATLAGCAQLAGIDNTTGEGLPGASVEVHRMSIGSTVEVAPLDLTGLQADYLVERTGSEGEFDRVPASDGGGGAWVTKLRAPAPVVLTLPDVPTPLPRMFAFPNLALSVLFSSLERRDRSPPPPDAILTVTALLDTPTAMTDSFEVFTVGSWTSHPVPFDMPDVSEVSVTYPFDESTSLSGRAQLDRLTARDAFFVLRYAGDALTGVAEAAPFEQTGDDTVAATMVPVDADRTIDVLLGADIAKRYTIVRPAVDDLSMSWSVVAAPGARVASIAGPVLNSGTVMAADTGVAARFGNPFAAPPHGWSAIFTLVTTESREFMLPVAGADPPVTLPVALFAGMSQYVDASQGVTGLVGLDAALPETIRLGGRSLSSDGLTIARPTGFVEIEIEIDLVADPATNTLYSVQLFDLLPDPEMPPTRFEPRLVFEAHGTEVRFWLPPEIFQVGHSYTLRALSIAGGFPDIDNGNLTMRKLPLSQSFVDSGVFTVTP